MGPNKLIYLVQWGTPVEPVCNGNLKTLPSVPPDMQLPEGGRNSHFLMCPVYGCSVIRRFLSSLRNLSPSCLNGSFPALQEARGSPCPTAVAGVCTFHTLMIFHLWSPYTDAHHSLRVISYPRALAFSSKQWPVLASRHCVGTHEGKEQVDLKSCKLESIAW